MNLPQAMVPTLLGLLLVLHPNSTAPAPNPFLPGVAGEAGRASSLGSEAHILATGTSEADILHTGALSSNNPKDVVDPSTLSGDGLKHSNPLVPTPEVPQVENSIKDGDSSANIIPHIPESEPNPSSLATTDGNDADTSPPMTVRWWDETYQEPPPPSYESAIRDYPPPEKESGASSPRTEPEGSSSWGSAPTGRPDGVTKPRTFLGKTGHAAWSIIKSPFTLLGWFGKQWDNLTVKLAMRTLYKKRPTYLTEEASRINKAREEQIAPLGEGLRRLKANPKSWVERMQNAQSVFKAKWKDTLLYRIWRGKKTSEPKLDPSTDKPAVSTEYSSFPEAAGESSGLTRGAENLDHSEVQPLASAELPGQPPSGTSAPEFMPEPIHPMGSSGGAGGLTSEGGSGAATSGNVPIILSGEEQTASKEVPLLANDRHPSGTSTFENLKETPKGAVSYSLPYDIPALEQIKTSHPIKETSSHPADELQSPQKGADGMKNTPGSPENTINWPENSGSRLSSLMRTLSQSFLGR